MPPLGRRLQYPLDLLTLASALSLAYLIRFDFDLPEKDVRQLFAQLPCVAAIQFAALWGAGVHRFIWRYVGLAEARKFLCAAIWSALPLVLIRVALPGHVPYARVPYSVIVIDTCLAFGGCLALRVLHRCRHERRRRKQAGVSDAERKPILLIGAGRAGVLTAAEIRARGDVDFDIKGFVDDDPGKHGSVIQGVRVVGGTEDLPRLVRELKIDHVVISIAQGTRQEFRRILDVCERVPVRVRVIPGLYELLEGAVKVSRIRDVQVEDLISREPARLDEESLREFLSGRVIMITGAGGTVGAELTRQVARYQPDRVLLVERSEFALFNIEREMRGLWPRLTFVPLIADVADEVRMSAVFASHRPQVVLHASAHKHVPMMESNVPEAVKNNVLATAVVGRLAGEYKAEAFVLVSTDKAVRPTSVMGASKRVAELVIQDLQRHHRTRYVAVRFGNVIGSAGSIISLFREQILKGGPVPVTHPEMARHFMAVPEAAQLILQAGAIGRDGDIHVLDMGEPVRILDLAKETIRLSGLKPFEDINIVFTGIRPGEKLLEESHETGERLTRTSHPKIFSAEAVGGSPKRVLHSLSQLSVLATDGDERAIRRFLGELLPEARLEVKEGGQPELLAAAQMTAQSA
jgi:FlaA1/EpsC-like NDP-sugar epimerase